MSPAAPFMVRNRRLIGGGLLLVAAVCLALVWRSSTRRGESAHGSSAVAPASTYVGSGACEACHAGEGQAWRGSQHAQAMAEATGSSVRGRFDGQQVTYAGITSSFFRRAGKFYVRTDGADGRLADFEITYTFGVFPLQQYLVAFPRGRLQALSLAWDTRPVTAGGQRWFHLYPNERITAGDPLHWTGAHQNWNFMCADCHSTNVRKGYDPATRQYATTWSEPSVGCEACHGPGGDHIAWARRGGAAVEARADRYLAAQLDERKGVVWGIDPARQSPLRSRPRLSDREIEVCARCHARRGQVTDAIEAGDRFEDGFRASLLEPVLFHADGQQRDEVYTYVSFLQSRMYAKGVTCSDCHDPHTGTRRLPGNALCTQCHLPSKYDTPGHSRHTAGSAASACVVCHMPAKTYMSVDPRRDHSFRIPRPDLAVQLAVPDVCTTACHRNRSAAWASAALERRYGHAPATSRDFGGIFHAAERGAPDRAAGLQRLASDAEQPAIVRASALQRLAAGGDLLSVEVAPGVLADPSALVRRAALAALRGADAATRLRLVPPLLSDAVRTVRIQAAMSLEDLANAGLPEPFRASFGRALDEYLSEQRFNGDRPEAQTNLGTTLAGLGQTVESIAAFRESIALDRSYIPAYVNLADVHRSQGNEAEAEQMLREAIAVTPTAAPAHHALGLSLVRQRRIPEALAALAEAARLESGNPRYAYVYAVALHDTGSAAQALTALRASLARYPRDRDTLYLLATYAIETGRLSDARAYAARLSALEPDAADVRSLLQRLQVSPSSRPGPGARDR